MTTETLETPPDTQRGPGRPKKSSRVPAVGDKVYYWSLFQGKLTPVLGFLVGDIGRGEWNVTVFPPAGGQVTHRGRSQVDEPTAGGWSFAK